MLCCDIGNAVTLTAGVPRLHISNCILLYWGRWGSLSSLEAGRPSVSVARSLASICSYGLILGSVHATELHSGIRDAGFMHAQLWRNYYGL